MIIDTDIKAAIFIADRLHHDSQVFESPTTALAVEVAVQDFLDNCDPRIDFDRANITYLTGIIAIP